VRQTADCKLLQLLQQHFNSFAESAAIALAANLIAWK
jgi:hypothetical protein